MAEINTLGAVIKGTYEGQPDTNPFTDSAVATLAGLATVDDEAFDPTAIDLSRNSAPDYVQSGAVQLALAGGVAPVGGAAAWIAWTGDGSAVTPDGVTVKWPDGTAGAKSWAGQRPLAVVYHPALGHAVAFLDGAADFATAAQGAKADTALQPADVGTAAAEDVEAFATAAQGALAASALQPAAIGAWSRLGTSTLTRSRRWLIRRPSSLKSRRAPT